MTRDRIGHVAIVVALILSRLELAQRLGRLRRDVLMLRELRLAADAGVRRVASVGGWGPRYGTGPIAGVGR